MKRDKVFLPPTIFIFTTKYDERKTKNHRWDFFENDDKETKPFIFVCMLEDKSFEYCSHQINILPRIPSADELRVLVLVYETDEELKLLPLIQ